MCHTKLSLSINVENNDTNQPILLLHYIAWSLGAVPCAASSSSKCRLSNQTPLYSQCVDSHWLGLPSINQSKHNGFPNPNYERIDTIYILAIREVVTYNCLLS